MMEIGSTPRLSWKAVEGGVVARPAVDDQAPVGAVLSAWSWWRCLTTPPAPCNGATIPGLSPRFEGNRPTRGVQSELAGKPWFWRAYSHAHPREQRRVTDKARPPCLSAHGSVCRTTRDQLSTVRGGRAGFHARVCRNPHGVDPGSRVRGERVGGVVSLPHCAATRRMSSRATTPKSPPPVRGLIRRRGMRYPPTGRRPGPLIGGRRRR
jgi:hypothetical protein